MQIEAGVRDLVRNFRRMFTLFLLLAVLTPFFPKASAITSSYSISRYQIGINVRQDGNADVEERITFSFDGTFHGVYLNLDPSGTDGITNMRLSCIRDGAERTFVQSDSEQEGTYTVSKDGNIDKYKVFEPSKNEDKMFIFRYRLQNVIRSYQDSAEFDRLVIPKNWEADIHDLNVTVNLPNGAKKEDLRVFAHGPLTGESAILNGKTVQFTVPVVPAYTYVETIVLFPPSLTPDCKYKSADRHLPVVLEREGKLAQEANREREQARQIAANEKFYTRVEYSVIGVLFLFWVLLMIFLYLKYDRELRPQFDGKYCRELPGDYSPAVMSLLVNGRLGSKDIMATLLDLTRRKYLKIEKITTEKKGLFHKSKNEKYKITENRSGGEGLAPHEAFLVDWFIHKIGDGSSITLDDIGDYAKTNENAQNFNSAYQTWKDLSKDRFESLNFYDKSIFSGKLLGVLLGILFAAAGFLFLFLLQNAAGILLIVCGMIMLIYSALFKRRTQYGNEQHAMWIAFKRFLEDFSQMKKAEIGSIAVWEHYLVYAVSLGVARNVIQHMPELVDMQSPDGSDMITGMLFWQIGGYSAFFSAFDNCMHAVDSAIITAQQVASSSNSSGSGFGGGFSGGGGFGGGGGGGGGAF